jgi:hypothetical protein
MQIILEKFVKQTTLKIRYELAHCNTENEILQHLSQESKRHAENAEQQVQNCLEHEINTKLEEMNFSFLINAANLNE